MKKCSCCKSGRPNTDFHRHSKRLDGLQSVCKDCHRKYAAENRYRLLRYKQDHYNKKSHGISLQDREEIGASQEWKCASCGDEVWAKNGGLRGELDHDHITGKIRALLCFHCNTALGLLKDDPSRIVALLDYLKRYMC